MNTEIFYSDVSYPLTVRESIAASMKVYVEEVDILQVRDIVYQANYIEPLRLLTVSNRLLSVSEFSNISVDFQVRITIYIIPLCLYRNLQNECILNVLDGR